MNHATKLARIFTQPIVSSTRTPTIKSVARQSAASSGSVRCLQVSSSGSDPKQPGSGKFDNMDKALKSPSEADPKKPENVMTRSFGEGYATRSDEEGFGGIYGGNDECEVEAKVIHEERHGFDHSQGSEVREKEKARHQAHVNN